MRFFSPLLILAALLAAACGGAAVFPEVFSQERADGKIPVSIELIKKQTRKEIDGMPEKQATAERWRKIEADYNACRVSSSRKTKAAANKVFADCMSRLGYVYMLRLDAEQLHDEIAAEEPAKYAAEKKAKEEKRRAAEQRHKEFAAAAKRKRQAERLAAEKKAAQEEKDSNLINWAIQGNIVEVRAWLSQGANPNAALDSGETVLVGAAIFGYPKIVKALLDAGANPNTVADDSWTALMHAASEGHLEVTRMLLNAGANPSAVLNDGMTALMVAAGNGNTEVVKMLLTADVNLHARNDSGWTALMVAAGVGGHLEVVKTLLAAGAHTNAANGEATALMIAVSSEEPEIVRILLECGANPSARFNHGTDAWDLAKLHPAILPIFLQYQAKIATGWTPQSCKSKAVANTAAPKATNAAAHVFENTWRSIVVVHQGKNQGSGVIVRPNVVATNCHVIDGYGDIVVYKHDNRRASTDTLYNATVRKRDESRDFCLLYVAGLRGVSVKLREYRTLTVGEDVYAVGSPKGLDLSLSSGIISQLRQGTDVRYIQTDAAVSPGSSGGGLFDSDGNLIGFLTAKIADEDVEGIGFAIPADLAINL